MALFGWFRGSACKILASLPFSGSPRSSSSLSCGRQRCLKFKHYGNLHGNLHGNPLSPCHPQEALPKVEGKQLRCLQPTVVSPLPLPDRRGGDGGCGLQCGHWPSLTLLGGKTGIKTKSYICVVRKPTIGNYL